MFSTAQDHNIKYIKKFNPVIYFVYQNVYEHFTPAFRLHNNLCEITALQIQKVILYSKAGLTRSF